MLCMNMFCQPISTFSDTIRVLILAKMPCFVCKKSSQSYPNTHFVITTFFISYLLSINYYLYEDQTGIVNL